MHKLNRPLTLLALAVLSLTTVSLHADSITATLTADGTTATLLETPILNGEQFTYINLNSVTTLIPPTDNTSLNTFVATYVDVSGLAGVLNVTDVCAQAALNTAAVPCQNLAFSFTDLTLGNVSLVAAIDASVFASGNVADVNFEGSIAGGSATFDFGGSPSAVPEPSTLSFLATGLLGAAGVFRCKFLA